MPATYSPSETTKTMDESRLVRQWTTVNAGDDDNASLSVASWNVLAQCYILDHTQFPETPRKLLKRKRRQKQVIQHLQAFAKPHLPDIVCLQEVDCYESFYHGELRKLGYGVAYKQRTCRTKVKNDGSLVAYQTNRFKLIQTDHLEFNHLADVDALSFEDDNYLVRESVAAVCVLRDLRNDQLFIVASAHLYWNPVCVDIKILQAVSLLRRVNDIAASMQDVKAVLVCGDFNSTPDSAPFSLLTDGRLDRAHKHCVKLQPEVADYVDNVLDGCTTVPSLISSYQVGDQVKIGAVSTLTDKWFGCIDHIMYRRLNCEQNDAEQALVTVGTLTLPTVAECKKARIRAFPGYVCPSDHLPVAAVLNLLDDGERS